MPYSGLMPSLEAIKQACREPLDGAPREHKAFAVYIFERAREIDHQWAMARKLKWQPQSGSNGQPPASKAGALAN